MAFNKLLAVYVLQLPSCIAPQRKCPDVLQEDIWVDVSNHTWWCLGSVWDNRFFLWFFSMLLLKYRCRSSGTGLGSPGIGTSSSLTNEGNQGPINSQEASGEEHPKRKTATKGNWASWRCDAKQQGASFTGGWAGPAREWSHWGRCAKTRWELQFGLESAHLCLLLCVSALIYYFLFITS